MQVSEMKELIRAMSEYGLTELEYEWEEGRFTLKKESKVVISEKPSYPAEAPIAPVDAASPIQEAGSMEGKVVVSPLVGTVYLGPAEGEPPFVQEGDTVKKGQVLAIVEAMKLMNEIESEYGGEVARVLVENGQTVEYGQPLFEIR